MALPKLLAIGLQAALAAGASYAASALSRKPGPIADDGKQPTLSTRGSYLPYVVGTRRVSPVIAFVGPRGANEVGGGKGGGGSGGYHYYAELVHLVTLGSADQLLGIYRGGELIAPIIYETIEKWCYWPTPPFTRYACNEERRRPGTPYQVATTPGGTTINIDDYGGFDWYWGQPEQPINDLLASPDKLNVASQWPWFCYAHWRPHNYREQIYAPQIEYEVRVPLLPMPTLNQWTASQWLDNGDTSGANPAHLAWQLLTARPPHGLGIPTSALDGDSFDNLGVEFATNHLPLNLVIRDSVTALEWIDRLIDECGFALPRVNTRLMAKPLRPPGIGDVVYGVGDDVLEGRSPPLPQQIGAPTQRSLTLTLPDRLNNYRPAEVVGRNDAASQAAYANGLRHPTEDDREELTLVTDKAVGYDILMRKRREAMRPAAGASITVLRGAADLRPGDYTNVAGVGKCYVTRSVVSHARRRTKLDLIVEQYTEAGGAGPPGLNDDYRRGGAAAPPDIAFLPLQLPASVSGSSSTPYITVIRARASSSVIDAGILVSPNGTTFTAYGSQAGWGAVGQINRPVTNTEGIVDGGGRLILAEGPHIEPMTGSVADDWFGFLDLTGNDTEWAGGAQGLVLVHPDGITQEVWFFRRLDPRNGGYVPIDCIRKSYCTTAGSFPANELSGGRAEAYLFVSSRQRRIGGAAITAGSTAYVKAVPATEQQVADPSGITARTVAVATPSC